MNKEAPVTEHKAAKADPSADQSNPKIYPDESSNAIKDPHQWTTGGEPMTGAQASYLKTLSEQAGDPDAFDPDLSKAEASMKIDELKEETGR